MGILIYADNNIANWDCMELKAKVESLGIDIPEHFERANKQYMEAFCGVYYGVKESGNGQRTDIADLLFII